MNIKAFLITSFAGLSTMLGSILIFKKKKDNIIENSLAFSAGVMITVSLLDLIPESYHSLSILFRFIPTILLLLIGFNLGIILSFYLRKKTSSYDGLYKIGIISTLAIIAHNIPEGIATYLTCDKNLRFGMKLALAIALHNLPEGISISVPIYYATKSKKKALFYTFISGFSEVIGAIISYLFLQNIKGDMFMGILYAFIAGVMISISIKELLKEAFKVKKPYLFFILGILFMTLSSIFI